MSQQPLFPFGNSFTMTIPLFSLERPYKTKIRRKSGLVKVFLNAFTDKRKSANMFCDLLFLLILNESNQKTFDKNFYELISIP